MRPLRPQGEWNTGRILVDGTHVEHWLNGEKMVEYEVRSPEWAALVARTPTTPSTVGVATETSTSSR